MSNLNYFDFTALLEEEKSKLDKKIKEIKTLNDKYANLRFAKNNIYFSLSKNKNNNKNISSFEESYTNNWTKHIRTNKIRLIIKEVINNTNYSLTSSTSIDLFEIDRNYYANNVIKRIFPFVDKLKKYNVPQKIIGNILVHVSSNKTNKITDQTTIPDSLKKLIILT